MKANLDLGKAIWLAGTAIVLVLTFAAIAHQGKKPVPKGPFNIRVFSDNFSDWSINVQLFKNMYEDTRASTFHETPAEQTRKAIDNWNDLVANWRFIPSPEGHELKLGQDNGSAVLVYGYGGKGGVDPAESLCPLRIQVEQPSGGRVTTNFDFLMDRPLSEDQYDAIHALLAPCHQQCEVDQKCEPMKVPVITGTDANGKPITEMKKLIQYVDYYKKSMFVKTEPL